MFLIPNFTTKKSVQFKSGVYSGDPYRTDWKIRFGMVSGYIFLYRTEPI